MIQRLSYSASPLEVDVRFRLERSLQFPSHLFRPKQPTYSFPVTHSGQNSQHSFLSHPCRPKQSTYSFPVAHSGQNSQHGFLDVYSTGETCESRFAHTGDTYGCGTMCQILCSAEGHYRYIKANTQIHHRAIIAYLLKIAPQKPIFRYIRVLNDHAKEIAAQYMATLTRPTI